MDPSLRVYTITTTHTTTMASPDCASHPVLLVLASVFAFPTLFWLVAYLVPQIYVCLRPVPNLKKKYDADWALVSGAGSGIGKALAFKLASQGLNVVIVSLDDKFLTETMDEIQAAYPKQQFRSVPTNFAPGVPYMEKIIKATKDIEIPIVFCNAGFMVTGFLDQAPIEKLLANIECNATSAVNLAHYFVKPLISKKKKGCIVFTSSVAGFIPTRTSKKVLRVTFDEICFRIFIHSFKLAHRCIGTTLVFFITKPLPPCTLVRKLLSVSLLLACILK